MAGKEEKQMVLSYKTMRRFLGWLGFFLPVILLIGGITSEDCLRTSISCFYYSELPFLHGIYLGSLCAMGVFLISYRGHEPNPGEYLSDNFITSVAGICAIAVAIFPIDQDCLPDARCLAVNAISFGEQNCALWSIFKIESIEDIFPWIHYLSAAGFFIAIAFMSLCMFTKHKENEPYTRQKCLRNLVYKVCAIIIFLSVSFLIVQFLLREVPELRNFVDKFKMIFWVESLAIWAFAVSWLIKGQVVLADKKGKDILYDKCPSLCVLLCRSEKVSSE